MALAAIILISHATTMAQSKSPQASIEASDEEIGRANERIAAEVAEASIDSPGQVVVVYFTPRDRAPAANHTERIRRIVAETKGFYDQELERHGFDNRSMQVLRNDAGDVDVIDVIGVDANYDKPDGGRIRKEVVPVLRDLGINAETSVLLIFCNLMEYDPVASTIRHYSPYYGGGSHLAGNAWQCDSEILDPKRFRDPTPILDGEYGRITIGRHNSIFIGGVIHELGHALSLPHCRARSDQAERGTALMGSGNQTYAQQLRNEGLGTFLTQAHALRLAAHPAFNRQVSSTLRERTASDYEALKVSVGEDDSIQIEGRVSSNIPVHGLVAYFDPEGGGDYDAKTATAVPNDEDQFFMRSEQLPANQAGELRLVACHVNGATTTRTMRYRVDAKGRPDLTAVRLKLELAPMLDALRAGELAEAESQLVALAKGDATLTAIGQRVLDRFADVGKPASIDPGETPKDQTRIALSELQPVSASVGWNRVSYNGVPGNERLLSLGGDVFARGVYAHAPAMHVYEIGGAWKRLSGRCGMQSSHFGRVDFEILGDGRSLWSARRVSAGDGREFNVDIKGVQQLTLLVGDSGDGRGGDWGVWIEPVLSR